MILFHGTTRENGLKIIKDGVINGPVSLTPSIETAENYAASNASDYMVFEFNIDATEEFLDHDAEFVKCGDGDWLKESLENGAAVSKNNLLINGCTIRHYEDYELESVE